MESDTVPVLNQDGLQCHDVGEPTGRPATGTQNPATLPKEIKAWSKHLGCEVMSLAKSMQNL